jgi:hypothetical protein
MAFSKTPELETHQTKRIPIIGGQTIASNVIDVSGYQGQRYKNCYPKRLKLTNTDDKWVLTKTPSIATAQVTFTSSGTDAITSISDDGKWIWKGRRLYTWSGGAPSHTAASGTYVISMHRVIDPVGTDEIYAGILQNGSLFSYTWNNNTSTFTLSAALPFSTYNALALPVPNLSAVLNGRLYVLTNGGRIYNSNPGAYLTFSSTSFIVPETKGDLCQAIINYKNNLVAFSSQSTEFFYDGAIELGSPLVRQEAYTQLYGIFDRTDLAQLGDNVFFMSWGDRQGFGIYTLDNFNVTKISNSYIDTLLNNDDMTGGSPSNFDVYMAVMSGDVCGAVGLTISNHLAYNFTQGAWFEYDCPIATIHPPGGGGITVAQSLVTGSQYRTTFFVLPYGTDIITYSYLSQDYNPSISITAEYVEDIQDFGSQRWKHFEQIYAIGDFGNNTVELAYTPYMDYTNWSTYQSRTPVQHDMIRYQNLGRYRRLARRWRFAGTSNIMMEGSEIRYNLGSQ